MVAALYDKTLYSGPLSPQEERQILEAIKEGDQDAKERLVMSFKLYVWKVVNTWFYRWATDNETLEDFFQVGCTGLLYAAKKYDMQRSVPFLGYAHNWIKQHIFRYIVATHTSIRLPDKSYIPKYREEYRALIDTTKTVSYDKEPLLVENASYNEKPPVDALVDSYVKQEVTKAFSHLTPKQMMVLELYYGLNGKEARTMEEVAESMGITRQAVSFKLRQIRKKLAPHLSHVGGLE